MKKGMTLITAVLGAVALFLGALTVTNSIKSNKEFISDGYILDPSKEEAMIEGANMQYYFTQGEKYKEKFGTSILFKNQDGDDTKLSMEHFIHYSDGSLGAFTKGVLLDVSDLNASNYGYYSLTKNTILVRNGNSYELSTKGEALSLSEYVWKISDTDYMLISPTVTLTVGNQTMDFEDYAQITYVDNGIVRISHAMGTYQTISAESTLTIDSGAQMNLVGKSFDLGDGEILSLDSLALNDDSYIQVDDTNEDKINIPTFNVINGKDGANGTNGESGDNGEQGTEGEKGSEGEAGSEGSEGSQGSEGTQGSDGSDGVIGQDGGDGYDGQVGAMGLDGANAAGASSVSSAELNLKPTITMDAGTGGTNYKVTANSATMTMDLEDTDGALGSDVKVYVYNKNTMELANGYTEEMATSNGNNLYSSKNLNLDVKGLDPNTEYVVVVKGSYAADSANTLSGVTFFTKTFKTDTLGVSIGKLKVTENSISVKTLVNDSSVSGYTVKFYDSDTGNTQLGQFIVTSATGGEFELSGTDVATGTLSNSSTVSVSGTQGYTIKNNHQYYACLSAVNGTDKTGDTEISLMTLKKTPYQKETNASGSHDAITSMQPTLTPNNLSQKFVLSLPEIEDPDNGVKRYRYELYNSSNELVATKESESYTDQTFEVADTTMQYYAKVVAIFNNNEADVELTTLPSAGASLTDSAGQLNVQIIVNPSTITDGSTATAAYDEIAGEIVITDPANELKVTGTNKLKLALYNSYSDSVVLNWASQD